MEQRAYYSVENLTTLKAENNSLFTQMVAVTEQVYRLCQPEKTTVITTVTFMDVVEYLDLLDDLSKLLYNINQFLKSSSADRFFTVSPIINSGALRQRLLSCCIRRRLHGKAGLRQCRKVIRYRDFAVLSLYRFHIFIFIWIFAPALSFIRLPEQKSHFVQDPIPLTVTSIIDQEPFLILVILSQYAGASGAVFLYFSSISGTTSKNRSRFQTFLIGTHSSSVTW